MKPYNVTITYITTAPIDAESKEDAELAGRHLTAFDAVAMCMPLDIISVEAEEAHNSNEVRVKV